jgi:hypothetical protein
MVNRPLLLAASVCLIIPGCGNDQGPTPSIEEPPAGFATQNLIILPATEPVAPVVIWGHDGSRLVPIYASAGDIAEAVLTTANAAVDGLL